MWDFLHYYPAISQWLPLIPFFMVLDSLFLGSCVFFPLIYSLMLLNHIFQWHLEQEHREGSSPVVYPRAISSCSVAWEAGIYGDNIGSLLAFWLPVDFGEWEIRKLSGRKRKSGSLFSGSLLFELWVGGGHRLCEWLSPVAAALSRLGRSALWQFSTLGSRGESHRF